MLSGNSLCSKKYSNSNPRCKGQRYPFWMKPNETNFASTKKSNDHPNPNQSQSQSSFKPLNFEGISNKSSSSKGKKRKRSFMDTFDDENDFNKAFPNNSKIHIKDKMVISSNHNRNNNNFNNNGMMSNSRPKIKINRKRSLIEINSDIECKDNIKNMEFNNDDTINGLQNAVKKLKLWNPKTNKISEVLYNNKHEIIEELNTEKTLLIDNKMDIEQKTKTSQHNLDDSIINLDNHITKIHYFHSNDQIFAKLNRLECNFHRHRFQLSPQNGALIRYVNPNSNIWKVVEKNDDIKNIKKIKIRKKRAARLNPSGSCGAGDVFKDNINNSQQIKKYINQCYVSYKLQKEKKEKAEKEQQQSNDYSNNSNKMDCD